MDRQKIFKEELKKLKDKQYLDEFYFQKVNKAYDKFHNDYSINKVITKENPEITQNVLPKQEVREERDVKTETKSLKTEYVPQQQKKSTKSAEQVRERNISLVLITGVILLLFGGLILATTSWSFIGDGLKVLLISMVSILFGGMSFVANKLNIKQTSFAFLTLCSLFIPITILSASYYGVFGEYLSLDGKGRSLLGFISGLLCLWIYFKVTNYFKSKVFTVFTLLTSALTLIFGLVYVTPNIDIFLFMLMLINILIILNIENIKNISQLNILKNYLFHFIHIKVWIDTFVVMTLFSSNIFYALSLIISAILFLIFTLKFNRKYYSFMFSTLFTYGYLHLIFNTSLDQLNVIMVALLPAVYFGLSHYIKSINQFIYQNFKYTGLTATGFAFIYINGNAVVEKEYILGAVSMLILVAQYHFLLNKFKHKLTGIPLFIFISNGLLYFALFLEFDTHLVLINLFIVQFIIMWNLYITREKEHILTFSGIVVSLSMGIGLMLIAFSLQEWIALSCILAITFVGLLYTHQNKNKHDLKIMCEFLAPISFILSLLSTYPLLVEHLDGWLSFSEHLIYTTVLSTVLMYFLNKYEKISWKSSLFIHQSLGFMAITLTFMISISDWIVCFMWIVNILYGILIIYHYKYKELWVLLVLSGSGLYMQFSSAINTQIEFTHMMGIYLSAGLIFTLVAITLKKYAKDGFPWFVGLALLCNIFSSLFAFVIYQGIEDLSKLYMLIPLVSYIGILLSIKKTKYKLILTYLALINICLFVESMYVGLMRETLHLSILITGLITIVISMICRSRKWKKGIDIFLIPLLHILLLILIARGLSTSFDLELLLIAIGTMTIAIWKIMKYKIDYILPIVLLLGTLFFGNLFAQHELNNEVAGYMLLSVVMLLLSKLFYYQLIDKLKIDWFKIFSFLFIIIMNIRVFGNAEDLSYQANIEIVSSILFVSLLFIFRYMTINNLEKKIYSIVGTVFIMYPYLVIIEYIEIPHVLEMEITLVPVVILGSILVRKVIISQFSQWIEMAMVGFVFFMLISDALLGNTINDALVLGTISIISIIVGLLLKYKSYFVAGIVTILLNIYLNTKFLWGNLPWWLYLIIGGLALIIVASLLELKKQREKITTKDVLSKHTNKIKKFFNNWS